MKLTKLGKISFVLAMFFATFGPLTGQIIGIRSITLLYNWFIILSFIIFLVQDKFKISIAIPKYLLLFIFFIFLHILITYTFFYPSDFFKNDVFLADSAFTNVLRYLVFVLFLYVFTRCINYRFFKSLTLAYSLGFIFVFLVSYSAISSGLINIDIETDGRFSGGSANANNFGMASFMVFILNIYILKRDSELKYKINYLSLFFVTTGFIGIFLSQSRSILFALALIIMYLVMKIPSFGRKLKFLVLTMLLVGIFYLVSPKELYENTFNRISTHSLTGKNGVQESRILIWANYLNELPSYCLTGKGFNRELSVNQADNTIIKFQPHNEYLIVLVQFGIFGLILYLFVIREIFNVLISNLKLTATLKQNNFSYQIFIALFLSWIVILLNVGQYQTSREYWLMLAIVCSSKKIHNY